MPADDEIIGQFTKWTHPDFDEGLILEPGDDPKGYLGSHGDASPFKAESVEMTRGEFNALPEFTG